MKSNKIYRWNLVRVFVASCLLLLSNAAFPNTNLPTLFFFFGPNEKLDLRSYQNILSNPYVSGAQVVYTWKELEPKPDKYDFARIKRDINYLNSIHKKLFIQLQDRSFAPKLYYVPDYIRNEAIYHGGVAMQNDFPGVGKPIMEGWVAKQWDAAVRARFQILFQKLAAQFDGQIYGINLPETAIDIDLKHPSEDFTSDGYFAAELENIAKLRQAFHKSIVIQYVNFFPNEWENDHDYMGRLFAYAASHHIGLGGPDVVPYRKGPMKNSYRFFHQYQGKLCHVGMAVQEPDYTYKDPRTNQYYSFVDFYAFAKDYVGASILFWNVQEPFLSKKLMPMLNKNYFVKG